jgi:hypothetical protein
MGIVACHACVTVSNPWDPQLSARSNRDVQDFAHCLHIGVPRHTVLPIWVVDICRHPAQALSV